MTFIYEDLGDLAGAIRRARKFADLGQEQLAEELGTSVGTVKRWEKAEEPTLGKTRQARRAVAILVAEITGAPREWFGLEPAAEGGPTEQRVAVLERQVQGILGLLDQDEARELAKLRAAGDAVAQRYETRSGPPEERDREAANE